MKDVRSRWSLVAVMITGWIVGSAVAQDVFPPPPFAPVDGVIDVANEAQRQMDALADVQRKTLQRSISVRIDELERVCQLQPDQLKKFRVAAKGVVERSMETWKKQFEQHPQPVPDINVFFGAPPIDFPKPPAEEEEAQIAAPEGPVDEDGFEEAVDEDAAEQEAIEEAKEDVGEGAPLEAPAVALLPPAPAVWVAPAPQPVQVFGAVQPNWQFAQAGVAILDEVEHHEIWMKALQNILTEEQKERYVEVRQRRARFRQKLMISAIVAELDSSLLLTQQQRDRVLAMLEQRSQQLKAADGGDLRALSQVPDDAFKGILSQVQLECLEDIQQSPVFRIDVNQIEAGVRVAPALPAMPIEAVRN